MRTKKFEYKNIRNQYFQEEAEELLKKFSDTLNKNNIMFWLEFGTLLGYYRENDFIKHDNDLDFGAYLYDADKIRKALLKIGFKLIRKYISTDGGLEECYRYKHTILDIFYFRANEQGLFCTTYTRNKKTFISRLLNRRPCTVKHITIPNNGFVSTTYKNCKVYIPSDCVTHLKMHYGENFMIPNPNFDYKKEASNIKYYKKDEISGLLKIYGKKY